MAHTAAEEVEYEGLNADAGYGVHMLAGALVSIALIVLVTVEIRDTRPRSHFFLRCLGWHYRARSHVPRR